MKKYEYQMVRATSPENFKEQLDLHGSNGFLAADFSVISATSNRSYPFEYFALMRAEIEES